MINDSSKAFLFYLYSILPTVHHPSQYIFNAPYNRSIATGSLNNLRTYIE